MVPPPGFVRYWLSAGRGNFSLSANSCLGSAFYCAAYTDPLPDEKLDGAPPAAAAPLIY
jgi:4-amino-4-deoxychorismate lyase